MTKQASRRKNQRIGCNVPASLTIDQKLHQVMLVDFCSNGLLIHCPDNLTATMEKKYENQHQVNLSCRLNSIKFEIKLFIRRSSGSFFGLHAPEGLPLLMIDGLKASTNQNESDSAPENSAALSSTDVNRLRLLAQDIATIYDEILTPAMSHYFRQLPAAFMSAAESSLQSRHIQELFDISRQIKPHSSEMHQQFCINVRHAIKEALSVPAISNSRAASPKAAALSLVETELFDQWMAIKATAQRIENQTDQLMRDAVARLKPLIKNPENTIIFPQGQTKALHEVFEKYLFSEKAGRVALEFFAKELMSAFKAYLTKLNTLLEKNGYFPQADIRAAPLNQASKFTSQLLKTPIADGLPQDSEKRQDSTPATAPSLERLRDMVARLEQVMPINHTLQSSKNSSSVNENSWSSNNQSNNKIQLTHPQLLKILSILLQDKLKKSLKESTESNAEQQQVKQEIVEQEIVEQPLIAVKTKNTSDIEGVRLLNSVQTQAATLNSTLSASDQMALELIDLYFDDVRSQRHLTLSIQYFIDELRPAFAYEFIKSKEVIGAKSIFQTLLFNLQEISYEQMAWTGASRSELEQAFKQWRVNISKELSELDSQLEQLHLVVRGVLDRIENVKSVNKKRVLTAIESKYKIQKKRNNIQVFLAGFLSKNQLVPKWFEQLMRMGWGEHLSLLAIRDQQEDLKIAQQRTSMFFNALNGLLEHTKLDDDLQTLLLNQLDYFILTLQKMNVSADLVSVWREKIKDLIHGHTNELVNLVPPSHWLKLSSPDQQKVLTPYMRHKLDQLHIDTWLHCPHQDEEKQYIKVVWIAPDKSRFLLVNHSFIIAGDFDASAMAELMCTPGSRIVLANRLPFKAKGIEHHFYTLYERLRGGLGLDATTGLLDVTGFEQAVQVLLDKQMPLCTLVYIKTERQSAHEKSLTIEQRDQITETISKELVDLHNKFNQSLGSNNICHLARIENGFAFCCIENEQLQFSNSRLVQFIQSIKEAASDLTLDDKNIGINFLFRCLALDQNIHQYADLFVRTLTQQKIEAEYLSNTSEENVQFISSRLLSDQEKYQNQVAWSQNVTIESLTERLSIRLSTLESLKDQKRQQISDGPKILKISVDEQEEGIIKSILNTNKSSLINQWILHQSLEVLNQDNYKNFDQVVVTLFLSNTGVTEFFEMVFEVMSHLKSNLKMHFCFQCDHLPDIAFLLDFHLELKSYGSRLMLSHWGSGYSNFDIFRHQCFDWLAIDPAIFSQASSSNSTSLKLMQTLHVLIAEMEVSVILPASECDHNFIVEMFDAVMAEN